LGSLVFVLKPSSMSQITYYTEEGLKKLKDELHEMESVQRPAISAQIAEARDKGDLSENAEYDAAKEAQGLLEARIAKLKEVISNARLINESEIDTSKVYILSTVKIKNVKNGAEMIYTLVAENEADLKAKKISVESPIGKGLLGKAVGDIADITTPNGVMQFEVVDISR
jgi:transcription elongation factor GreA